MRQILLSISIIGWLSVQTIAQTTTLKATKGATDVVVEVAAKAGKATEPFLLFGCNDKEVRGAAYDAYPTRALNDEQGERNKRRRNSIVASGGKRKNNNRRRSPATRGREMQQLEAIVVVGTSKQEEVIAVVGASKAVKVEVVKVAKAAKAKSSKAKCKKTKAAKVRLSVVLLVLCRGGMMFVFITAVANYCACSLPYYISASLPTYTLPQSVKPTGITITEVVIEATEDYHDYDKPTVTEPWTDPKVLDQDEIDKIFIENGFDPKMV